MKLWKCTIQYPTPTWGSLKEVVILAVCENNARIMSEKSFIEDTEITNVEINVEEIDSNNETIVSEKWNSN